MKLTCVYTLNNDLVRNPALNETLRIAGCLPCDANKNHIRVMRFMTLNGIPTIGIAFSDGNDEISNIKVGNFVNVDINDSYNIISSIQVYK